MEIMKETQYDFDKIQQSDDCDTSLLFEKVKWIEDGITYFGIVTEFHSEKVIKYLTVMTIFGRRCKVKMSKVRLISEHLRA